MNTPELIFILIVAALVVCAVFIRSTSVKSFKVEYDKNEVVFRHIVGHRVYELNKETLDMSEISAEPIKAEDGLWFRIVRQKGFLYCTALNEKNAIKRFSKMVNGKFEKAK